MDKPSEKRTTAHLTPQAAKPGRRLLEQMRNAFEGAYGRLNGKMRPSASRGSGSGEDGQDSRKADATPVNEVVSISFTVTVGIFIMLPSYAVRSFCLMVQASKGQC